MVRLFKGGKKAMNAMSWKENYFNKCYGIEGKLLVLFFKLFPNIMVSKSTRVKAEHNKVNWCGLCLISSSYLLSEAVS